MSPVREGSAELAAVLFENDTADGVVASCDWVCVEGGAITEIRSFYNSTRVREVLSPSELEGLDDRE